ncbi:VanZ family protein [Candidatus Roizmanbacteria bacterium]|nr:MAG: VanZ family protein [Candidatus Roizmanbacteria bacterium]
MNIKKFLLAWGPALALMITIFFLSSRQRIAVSEVYTINFIVFKSLHVIEYAALFFLVFRGFYRTLSHKNMKKVFLYAIVTTFLYALSDELHQTFVPTRNGSIRDLFIDSIGILLCFQYTKINLAKLKLFL